MNFMQDMTKGSPLRLLVSFSIPLLIGSLFQQFYTMADSIIVGKFVGADALASIGACSSVIYLLFSLFFGLSAGIGIVISQYFGAGDGSAVRRGIACSVYLLAAASLLLTLIGLVFARPILTILGTPSEIMQDAAAYFQITSAGIIAVAFYNGISSILRALGDSRTPVIWLIAASLLNIVLDFVFILTFHMDVFGAAFATILSQAIAGVGCLVRMCRGFPVLKMEKGDWRWDWRRARELCVMGLPMGLQYSITAIGSVMIQAAVNGLGTVYVTAVTAASKVSMFLCCPFDAMGATMATYGGQNVGAAKWERLDQGLRSCTVLGAVYAAVSLGIVFLFADPLNMLFLDAESTSLLPLARQYLLISAAFYFPLSLVNIVRFLIQGMGFSPLATLAGVLEMAARGFVSYLVPVFGFAAACYASPAAWVLADLFLVPAYFYCRRKLARPEGARRTAPAVNCR